MPAASRSGIALLLFGLFFMLLGSPPETADPLALAEHKADQAERPKQDHEEEQQSQNDRPNLAVIVRQPEADALDDDRADHGADQRAGAAEQDVEHDLGRDDDAD